MGVKKKDAVKGRVSETELALKSTNAALSSFNVLFERPASDGSLELGDFDNRLFLGALKAALQAVAEDLMLLDSEPSSAERLYKALDVGADSVDRLNELERLCHVKGLRALLAPAIFEAATPPMGDSEDSPASAHLRKHGERLAASLAGLFPDYAKLLASLAGDGSGAPPRLSPDVSKLRVPQGVLRGVSGSADPFSGGRAFRHIDGEFVPVELESIRKVEDFYGYPDARRRFMDRFKAFSEARSNLPLLITSLPGLGKTHFCISYTLHFPNLTLILPEPGDLERPLEKLIRRLAARKDRRFVLFFDDVDAPRIDWYFFRTNVGGSFCLPSNVIIAIASNYQFPANISSRGTGLSFPMFDEIRCQEMIFDFLRSFGMRQPPAELVSVIAADYVEEFGQKFFEELSPRTLVRYLDRYGNDSAKRMKMLDMSKGEVICKPDSQVFFETNVKLLKALYGEDALEELRKRQLQGG